MKKAKSAVKYGMETLKLSPDELFKLIESSQGYDGEDYSRWLAGKIIAVAEEDGVQFSQLLVKKFNIINEILEEVSESQEISEEFLDIFRSVLHKNLYSVDIEGIGEPLDVDWYSGLDLDEENSFFVMEKLPFDLRGNILENEKLSVLFRLSLEGADKKSDLYSDARGQGLILNSKGAMLLYRLCSIASNFDISNSKFGVLVPVKFLYDKENEGIIEYMLNFFKISEGYSIKSIEMSLNSLNAGDMAFMTLETRDGEDEEQDGIVLTSITLNDEELSGFEELETKRYSRSSQCMLNKISDESISLEDDVMMQSLGEVSSLGKGLKGALGYLNINGSISLSTLPEEGKKNIAITKDNIKDIIAYYGVTVARELDWGYSSDIPCLIDGGVGYDELLYNCLPLFLFDYNSGFKNIGDIENSLDVFKSPVIEDLLDVGMPYFSFEAKELFNTCKDYIEFSYKNMGITGKSFHELREMSDNSDFNNFYENKLVNLKEYVNTLSKNFL